MGSRKVRAVHRVAIYAIHADPASAAEAEKLAKLWYDVHKEDHAMYERLQADGHPTSPPTGEVLSPVWEDSVRSFQSLVLNALR